MTMRLLILDDDDAIGRLIMRVAALSAIDAVAVTEATAFAQHLRVDPPQVIMLDLQLTETDGVEQMRFLAQQGYSGSVVLMSGYDSRVLATACELAQTLGLKVGGVLEKPLKVADLEQMFECFQSANKAFSLQRVREAIANDELVLDFQPVINRQTRTLRKLEALVRWEHPAAGRIPPADFLPIVDSDTPTADALTHWTVGAAVAAYRVLQEVGITVPISVNVSPHNLHDLTLPNRIEQCLREGGMPMRDLCLELTEGAAFHDPARTMDVLSRLRLKGAQLSIDDFGTGYSSLTMLRQMPFTEIKIDRSFIADATTSRDSRTIVKCIIGMAANMGMACVAEGIETEATADLLEELGDCDMQGFFIAKPMPVEVVPVWLENWKRGDQHSLAHSAEIIRIHRRFAGRLQPAVADRPSEPDEEGRDAVRLPPQQFAVMRLLSEGCSIKEIARRLNLGIGTVKVHLSLAYSALGAHNRVEAVMRFLPMIDRGPTVQKASVTA
jgi:EAL domain-containing protein (putative c-di-GMP-specific phosphodiesterase class I)/DNA-binding CsgD family transcriptional regulator